MKSVIMAIVAFFLLTLNVCAEDFKVPEDVIQTAIEAKLPYTARSGKAIEIVFNPGSAIHLQNDGSVAINSAFVVTYKDKPVYQGRFNATANLVYDKETSAFYLSRIALDDPNGFSGEVIHAPAAPTSALRSALRNWAANRVDNVVEKYLNNRTALRDELEHHLTTWVEGKPVYKLDGSQFWHSKIADLLNQGKAEVLVRDKTLVLHSLVLHSLAP